MIQRSEIGKKVSVQSRIDVILNRVFVTPNNDKYSLISANITSGRKRLYVYEWLNCPQSIKDITTNTIQSKSELSLSEIMKWIGDLKTLI